MSLTYYTNKRVNSPKEFITDLLITSTTVIGHINLTYATEKDMADLANVTSEYYDKIIFVRSCNFKYEQVGSQKIKIKTKRGNTNASVYSQIEFKVAYSLNRYPVQNDRYYKMSKCFIHDNKLYETIHKIYDIKWFRNGSITITGVLDETNYSDIEPAIQILFDYLKLKLNISNDLVLTDLSKVMINYKTLITHEIDIKQANIWLMNYFSSNFYYDTNTICEYISQVYNETIEHSFNSFIEVMKQVKERTQAVEPHEVNDLFNWVPIKLVLKLKMLTQLLKSKYYVVFNDQIYKDIISLYIKLNPVPASLKHSMANYATWSEHIITSKMRLLKIYFKSAQVNKKTSPKPKSGTSVSAIICKIFDSGKVNIVGLKSEQDAYNIYKFVVDLFDKHPEFLK
jgi:hypothetical protein